MDIRTLFPEVKRLLDRTPVEDISSMLDNYLYDTGWLPEGNEMYYHPLFGKYCVYSVENTVKFSQNSERIFTVYSSLLDGGV